ncbi:protein serine/threonine phosphatase [Methyloglobulus morosus KoM1]|uniref:Protein serine/threonine phosphatase n=1 Tax=Methyloglobulus morosus KoM1 TaxID=1116472 RepID=V5C6H8_9GAMM|nr:PP2C family serine/threonine-protein phosphatase [Methyloglobulus morosus]ESS72368.1 protein serine/threonine phosphatase [Methyloglobulus morosus KoM1]
MQLEFFQFTNPGDRQYNQDYMAHIIENDYALFIVADGLGGHQAGEQASQFFCQGMLNCSHTYSKKIASNPASVFSDWIDEAVVEMKTLFDDDLIADQAYTTCAILYLDNDRAIAAHCGDSRVYRLNPKEIVWRTLDHSVPQDLLSVGLISEEELAHHPEQNHLTRSINANRAQPVDIKLFSPILKNETFVLCSDGFWGNIKPDELLQLADLDSNIVNINRLAMLSVYRANGNSDNLTVMTVRNRKD